MMAPWVLPKAPYLPFMEARTARAPGLSPLDMRNWTVRDADFAAQMVRRHEVLRDHSDLVIAALSEAEPAELELLSMLKAHLGQPPDLTLIERFCPLTALGRMAAEDFCIMLPDEESGEYRLVAAILCFPSRWLLSEKIGRSMTPIHEPVPDYDDVLARRVNRVFTGVRVERPMFRINWTIHPTAELFLPLGISDKQMMAPDKDGQMFLRTERQTLVRLPETGAVVFGIKTSVSPLDSLEPEQARILLSLIEAFDADERAYRGSPEVQARKIAVLQSISCAEAQTS